MTMKTTRLFIFLIIISFSVTVVCCSAQASASGYEDVESGEWWYYPMVVGSGNLLRCEFHTDGALVEYFIIHEDDYEENATLDYDLLLYHDNSVSDEFQLTLPRGGGWYWVFINHNLVDVRIYYDWQEYPQGLEAIPINMFVATLTLGLVLFIVGICYLRRRSQV
ncbi:MAG: hypothetical protein RTU92_09115 [Candidatus Thorarchaeota archaeon]